jgi:hypothetical protein
VTYKPIARQRLGKHIPAEDNARNSRTYIARRRCFPWGPPRGYITGSSKGAVGCCQKLREFSWRRVHVSELLGRVLEMAVESNWEEMVRKELGGAKKTYMWDLKLQWDCDKSVARILLMKTERLNKVSLNPIIESKTCLQSPLHVTILILTEYSNIFSILTE